MTIFLFVTGKERDIKNRLRDAVRVHETHHDGLGISKRTMPRRAIFVVDEESGHLFIFLEYGGTISKIQAYIAASRSSNKKREDDYDGSSDCGEKRTFSLAHCTVVDRKLPELHISPLE